MDPVDPLQPVVILGGFLITEEAYKPMAEWLRQQGVIDVQIVPVSRYDWLLTSWGFGWRRVLDRVDEMVKRLQAKSSSAHVTLIGHSSGGVMLRPYLSRQLFQGRSYAGATRCDRLITLGSPHQAVRATPLRAMVDRCFPGCHEPNVDYVAIAGDLDLQSEIASPFSRRSAKGSYRGIAGAVDVTGDGLVPVDSALLRDARHHILHDTAHGGLFGSKCYFTPERLEVWWHFVIT
ncbi:alpha/beta hydrolase family protein [Synechococcus sp. BIOS-E4-1]|uniref:esterase/lipase family protein n=1 Tax=Synechococcus sp. BIOS-E4-1 TaxID=1400864 RepID=UPI001645C3F3|nr:esterase [Synechococcus sp. BIOS-E4-1]QNI54886.1 alpha/beta hydrolase family protein [Synechococcus sp. BIOS-E4-1]